jgi:hypothetical protein
MRNVLKGRNFHHRRSTTGGDEKGWEKSGKQNTSETVHCPQRLHKRMNFNYFVFPYFWSDFGQIGLGKI